MTDRRGDLPLRRLGRASLPPITRLGLGTWAFGGSRWSWGWGPQDDELSTQTIHEAVGLGINWIDTAPEYGLSHSEKVVGTALRAIPTSERPLIFTKCGMAWGHDANAPTTHDLRPESIRRECESSLRRLGIDVIDLYQIHWPDVDTGTALEASWDAMLRLQSDGLVRAVGVSNFSVGELEICHGRGALTSVQPPLSLVSRAALQDVIPWAASHQVGVIAYSPLHSGMLTSKASPEWVASLPSSDWRKSDPDFRDPRLTHNLAIRDSLLRIAKRHQTSVSCVAIGWVLAQPGVTAAIGGARSPQQVREMLSAARLELSTADLDEIRLRA